MENIAFGSFDGETTDIIQTATNMTQNVGEGQYTPDELGDFRLWSGSREPDVGASGTTFTKNFTGTGSASLATNPNELTITDANDGVHNYSYDFDSAADNQFYLEWNVRIPTWTDYDTDTDGDANTLCGVLFRDGVNRVRVWYTREGGTSGERQVKISDDTNGQISDVDGNDAVFNVDWSQEHKYELYTVRGGEGILYVDGQLAIRFNMSDGSASVGSDVSWGTNSSGATAGTHIWREFNIRRFQSILETKVLNYRGSFAFEGDGTPTSATSAGTIQEITGSDDLFIEDNWDAADTSVTTGATITTVNAGEPNARLQGVLPGSARMFYRWDLDTDTNLGTSPYISARVRLEDVDNVSQDFYNFLGMQLDNKDIRLTGEYFDADTFDLRLAGNTVDTEVVAATTGEAFRFTEGEEAVIELRVVNQKTVQFLVNGQIQQECDYEVFGGNPATNRVFIGTVVNNDAADTLTWQWSEVRIGDSDAESFLPKNPIQEAIAVMDLEANVSTWISLSSDGGINWTAPKLIGIDGSSPLVSIPEDIAGGKIKARILSYGNDDARINNFALLYNSSANSGGLGTQFVHTFDSSDFSSEPGDKILEHNLKAAEDEILLFGGTEFLTKDLDWFFVDSDRILIKDAISGVPYEVRRIGFNFGETKNTVVVDREEKEAIGPWLEWTPTITAGGSMTVSNVNIKKARYRKVGNKVELSARLGFDLGGSADEEISVTLPVEASSVTGPASGETHHLFTAQRIAGSPFYTCFGSIQKGSETQMGIFREDQSNHSLGTAVDYVVQGFYEVDEENGFFEQVVTNVSNVGNNDTGVVTVQRKKIKVRGNSIIKTLSSDVASNGDISDLTFNGSLTPGKLYEITLVTLSERSAASTDLFQLQIFDGSSTTGTKIGEQQIYRTADASQFQTNTLVLEKTLSTDTLTVALQAIAANSSIQGNGTTNETFIIVTEINEETVVESVEGRTSAKTQDLDRAADGNPGILDYYNEETIDLTGSGDFTGGSIKVVRVNNVVTISQLTSITFPSDSNAESAVGLIPTWARPSSDMANVAAFGFRVTQVLSETDGIFRLVFRDWTGSLANETNVGAGITLSYVLD